jgi:hypothetical protein
MINNPNNTKMKEFKRKFRIFMKELKEHAVAASYAIHR